MLLKLLKQLLALLEAQQAMNEVEPKERLRLLAESQLGQHLTMDNSVPAEVGCAEAVSALLDKYGILMPPKGIPGTANLGLFLRANPRFKKVLTYIPGCIVLSETGSGNGTIRGHVAVASNTYMLSNNSNTGLWDKHWDITRWIQHYQVEGGIPTQYFIPV